MDVIRFSWQKPYLEALTEFDPAKLPLKINAAQRAIACRLRERPDFDELQALQDALANLRILMDTPSKSDESKSDVA
jgi:hypothetical protein